MAIFEVRNRAYSDNSISEVAGKLLPLHPTNRYSSFSDLWKKTRRPSGYLPRPTTCATKDNDFFFCCLSCGATDPDSVKELLVRRSANAGWISADWWWDFGWLLPAGFVNLGIGVTVPSPPVERDRVFVFKPDLTRGYLDLDLDSHAKAGADQHEAKAQVVNFNNVSFEGELTVNTSGDIRVAVPRSQWFGDGKKIWQRFIFQAPDMPYELSNLVLDNDNIKVVNGKIEFMGVEL
ncbi:MULTISPECIES: hypothetical protein [unclassified Microcoleus]|uniref:hypothetical protein n=1 Tax=unclassified Microcoleus TaxID=2642155 RepID=UPI002FCF1E83